MSELTFEQMLEESFKIPHTGEIVEGTVIDVKPEEIILNIGCKADGLLTKYEYTNDNSVDLTQVVKPGDMVVITAGDPATNLVRGRGNMTNMMHVIQAF